MTLEEAVETLRLLRDYLRVRGTRMVKDTEADAIHAVLAALERTDWRASLPYETELELKAALMDALHDDALTTQELIRQVAYTGQVRRERDEARRELHDWRNGRQLGSFQEDLNAERGRRIDAEARVAALEAALDRCHDVDCQRREGSEDYCPACEVLHARVQPAQGREEG